PRDTARHVALYQFRNRANGLALRTEQGAQPPWGPANRVGWLASLSGRGRRATRISACSPNHGRGPQPDAKMEKFFSSVRHAGIPVETPGSLPWRTLFHNLCGTLALRPWLTPPSIRSISETCSIAFKRGT